MFMTAVDAVRFQHGLSPTIVVGIGSPSDKLNQDQRYFDFTPVTPEDHLLHSGTEPAVKQGGTGGEDAFCDFILSQVRPAIASRFKVNPDRQVIFGHSLAGRFVLHMLFTHPTSFSAYIAASPSIWWNHGSLMDEARAFAASQRQAGARALPRADVLLTAGQMEQDSPPGTPQARLDFLSRARMVDRAREMAGVLKGLPGIGSAVFVEYAGENHGSVVPFAISRGVRFALAADPPQAGK
jgi:predicted alpha/beta superfamily hydrolase